MESTAARFCAVFMQPRDSQGDTFWTTLGINEYGGGWLIGLGVHFAESSDRSTLLTASAAP